MAGFTKKFDSAKQEWTTPQDLFEKLNEEFHFQVDLAADKNNSKCMIYFDEEADALKHPWHGICWLNPPYGAKQHKLQDWIKKAYNEAKIGKCTVVMLIPARTNTKWWHEYCMKAKEIRFICGRPKFGDAKHGLPQPLALIVFGQSYTNTTFSTFKLN